MGKIELMPTASALNKCLAALAKREGVLKAQIEAVCQSYTTACFVYGPGGLGKTHVIVGCLEAIRGKSWRHHTSYSTPKGLMLAIAAYPDDIHLFEDCEKMYKTDVGSSILRAACGSPRQRERWVTYETAHETMRVRFTGGVIIVSNENLSKSKGPLAAVASRFKPIKWDLTIQERVARILEIAGLGYSKNGALVTPQECLKVAKHLIEEMLTGHLSQPVDIRTFVEHAIPAYLQHRDGRTSVDWREIIKSKLTGEVSYGEKREERGDRLRQLAVAIAADSTLNRAQKMERWKSETGLGQAIFYRHLKAARIGS